MCIYYDSCLVLSNYRWLLYMLLLCGNIYNDANVAYRLIHWQYAKSIVDCECGFYCCVSFGGMGFESIIGFRNFEFNCFCESCANNELKDLSKWLVSILITRIPCFMFYTAHLWKIWYIISIITFFCSTNTQPYNIPYIWVFCAC